jgi:hypothetical protein
VETGRPVVITNEIGHSSKLQKFTCRTSPLPQPVSQTRAGNRPWATQQLTTVPVPDFPPQVALEVHFPGTVPLSHAASQQVSSGLQGQDDPSPVPWPG